MKKQFFLLFTFCLLILGLHAKPIKTNSRGTNLFGIITNDPTINKIVEFSAELASMDVLVFNILNRTSNKIDFSMSLGETYIRDTKFSTEGKTYSIVKTDTRYIITNDLNNTSVEYLVSTDEYYVNGITNIANIDLNSKTIDEYAELLLGIGLLNEFAEIDLVRNSQPVSITEAAAGRRYVGTGVGFWSNITDAQYFCERDKNKILENHPGWYTPGVSYSCLWGGHICICSANFYVN